MKLKDIEYMLERHYVNIRKCCYCGYIYCGYINEDIEQKNELKHLLLKHKEQLNKKELKIIKEFLKR